MRAISTRRQGDIGELSAMDWLGLQGYSIYIPIGHSPDCDLVADAGDRLLRVQVKTSTVYRKGRWEITVCTKGGNRSRNGLVKRLNASRIDYLFVLVADGRRWFIPSSAVGGGSGILLGGPKYANFEVDPGHPLPSQTTSRSLSSSPPGGVSERSKGRAVNLVGSAFAGSNPAPATVRVTPGATGFAVGSSG